MTNAVDAVGAALARIEADGRDGIWISLADRERVLTEARRVDERVAAGEDLPLAGQTVAVKDNIDVAGLPTTAGCPSYAYEPAADATGVAALRAAGAVVVGKTNLDQFATGLVGTRSPYGACPNAHWPDLVSGGSSSGSAVAVAAGLVDLALGTDTAGSGRVPAAANGIVGLKPTRGLIGTAGVVPACRSLDCVSVFARSVDDAVRAGAIAAARPDGDPWRRQAPATGPAADRPIRLGFPRPGDLTFDGDQEGPARHAGAISALLEAVPDVEAVPVDLAPFTEAAALLYGGTFVAERYEAVGDFVVTNPPDLDPVVGPIITAAGDLPGWQVFRDQTALARLRRATASTWHEIDVLVVPSVPRIPTQEEVAADPIGINTMLGTYTNFVNLLDLAALTVPIGEPTTTGPPTSLTLIGPAWSDDRLVALGRCVA